MLSKSLNSRTAHTATVVFNLKNKNCNQFSNFVVLLIKQ